MTITIDQIRGRAEQGVTRPFLCRGEDERWYYVKGRGAGLRSLLCEWIAGRLAQAFGLPVAPFEQVDVPAALMVTALRPELAELGSGVGFGSRRQDFAQELSVSHLDLIDPAVRRDVVVFDWWVHNQDRTLTGHGGNPNLLWDQEAAALVVIDHNQAFDPAFDPETFQQQHVFARDAAGAFDDLIERAQYFDRMEAALAVFHTACGEVPEEWWWVDDGVPADFDQGAVRQLLERFKAGDFWRRG
jgi:hypothetical protein